MAVTTAALAQSTTAAKTSASGDARTKLAENFDQFLTLLTAQLKNQDPTNPVDTNEFTNQLVMFAQVEQQIATNTNLESLLDINRTSQITAIAPLVGKRVEIDGPDLALQDGTGQFAFNNGNGHSTGRILITDPSGRVVRDQQISMNRGQNLLEWDGRDSSGARVPDGAYKVSVRAILPNRQEEPIAATTRATVTAAERSGDGFVLLLGQGLKVSPDKVRALAS
jgi:flagellar basal-body rod modification protein FlgD